MKQKHIALIGASGFIGSAILKEALDRGHHVTAIVRFPEKITIKNPHLKIKQGDVMDEQILQLLVQGTDAVISSYNPGWGNPNIAEDTKTGYHSIIQAVKAAKVKRLLIVGGAGSLFVEPNVRVMDTSMISEAILPAVKALADVYYGLEKKEKELQWTFFCPAGTIEHGKQTRKFRIGRNDLITDRNGDSKISVEDYAVAMIDELENPEHSFERFTIGY